MSLSGRIEKLGKLSWASPLEDFLGFGGGKSKTLDLAEAIPNNFSIYRPSSF